MEGAVLLLVAGLMPSDPDEKEALAAIRNLGGAVRRSTGKVRGWDVEFHLRGRNVTDDALAHVAVLKDTVSLNLRDTGITSAGLARLKGLTRLRRLHLERTQVDDGGIAHLSGLASLEYLNLYGTKVTDRSLDHLAGLKRLRRLYVWKTRVTDRGGARLKEKLPSLKIVRGVDLSSLPRYAPYEEDSNPPAGSVRWIATGDRADAPKSGNGINTEVFFDNKSGKAVKVYWVTFGNELKLYHELDPGGTRRQNTYANHTWLITDENDAPLGYFVMGMDAARAVIPKAE